MGFRSLLHTLMARPGDVKEPAILGDPKA